MNRSSDGTAAALAEQRRELQAQMELQRAQIAQALNGKSEVRSAGLYPRSKTMRFLKSRFDGFDRIVSKAVTAMIMTRIFGRKKSRH